MSRRALTYPANRIMARVVIEPSGNHRLDVETDNGIFIASYGAEAIGQMEEACARFRTLTVHADGGPDFHNRRTVPLELSR